MKNTSIKTVVAIGIGAALFFVLGRFVAIPSGVPNTNISLQYAVLGLLAAWYADRCWLHFDTRAVWWAQALKLVLGLALVMGVRLGLKAALAALFGEAPFADGVRYLCIALAGGVLWPMTFGFWSRLGRKRASQPHE